MNSVDHKVILLHGLGGHWTMLLLLRYRLRSLGFRPICYAYPSVRKSLRSISEKFTQYLLRLDEIGELYSIFSHSMGAVVVRAALANKAGSGLQRFAMLAPPNAGTPLALMAPRLVRGFCPPMEELSSQSDSFVNGLTQSLPIEFAVIAARFDALVPTWSTHLNGEVAHRTVNASHNSLLASAEVARMVGDFLKSGTFSSS